MSIFFTADPHFGDEAIRRYEQRPFADTREMDEALITRWNAVVSDVDSVYILGDLGGQGREREILSRLNGTKYLVRGNHDTQGNDYYRACGFAEVYDLPVLFQGFFLLSHEPLYVCRSMPYANLFGHVHASPLYRDFSAQHVCVSVERTDYTPITLEQVRELIGQAIRAEDEN